CDIHSGLHSVLLLIRVHPLRVTGPVIDQRRPWRHNTTTVASNRPNQTTIRVVMTTVVETQSSRRRTAPLREVRQARFGLTSGSRFNSTMNTGHFLEEAPSSRPWISGIRIPARLPADQL